MHKPFSNQSVYAILGFLNECEMSGYDIRKEAEDSIGYFWHESEGHLYPTLSQMARGGLIEEVNVKKRNSRQRKQYRITALGREKLVEWLNMPVIEGRVRNSFLLKLFFSKDAKPEAIKEHLERELFKRKEQLAIFKRIKDKIPLSTSNKKQQHLWEITLDFGLTMTSTWIDWLTKNLAAL